MSNHSFEADGYAAAQLQRQPMEMFGEGLLIGRVALMAFAQVIAAIIASGSVSLRTCVH
jgi:hypothetical protein